MNTSNRQHGATLVTALIMLVVLTLLVTSAITSSTTNLRIAGNMQVKEEAVAAAQQAVDQVASNDFTKRPALVAGPVPIDINHDGVTDYTANIATPTCNNSVRLPNNQPGLPVECYSGGKYDPNQSSASNCSAQQWDVSATVSNAYNSAAATMHQGMSVTVLADTLCP